MNKTYSEKIKCIDWNSENTCQRAKENNTCNGCYFAVSGYCQKENRSNPVIEKFLQDWKDKAFQYYKDLQVKYSEEKKKEYEITFDNLKMVRKFYWENTRQYNNDQINQILEDIKIGKMPINQINNLKIHIQCDQLKKWEQINGKTNINIIQHNDQWINKYLYHEVDSKRQNLIIRIQKKAGNILDASGLYIANNGEINGIIKGEKTTVRVETITAGGYNIQCYHFRVLVK